ncbi:rCG38138 [Rattus norvegicus]|uniref:RCG38138 n=1 Tax=Rattus norvegicus TaxID=10116 RepID=A6IVA5_RAT|nr:rCG38138 [Rattus norvegicus]
MKQRSRFCVMASAAHAALRDIMGKRVQNNQILPHM